MATNIYLEKEPIIPFQKNQNNFNNSNIHSFNPIMFNKNEISYNNSHSYKNFPYINNSNTNLNNQNNQYDNNYIRDRYTKIKEENKKKSLYLGMKILLCKSSSKK